MIGEQGDWEPKQGEGMGVGGVWVGVGGGGEEARLLTKAGM